jgi:hypothetical protein
MLNVKYHLNIEEMAQATYDFVTQRPLIRLMQILMSLGAILLCGAFLGRIYLRLPTSLTDLIAVLFSLCWLLFYKTLHKKLILHSMRKHAKPDLELELQITNHQIHLLNNQNYSSIKLPWKKLRFVSQNKFGYIFPLTGLNNAGKFIWLPLNSLQSHQHEDLKQLFAKFNIKIKSYSKN